MSKLALDGRDWEHVYSQFKDATGGRVMCLMHKDTKKFVYFDVGLNRMLTKQEAARFRLDATGLHVAFR